MDDILPPYATEQAHRTDIEQRPPPIEYSIFPRDIVFYRTEYISLIIGPQYEAKKPQPPPLFYVSVHMNNSWTNKSPIPQIRLHYGPSETHPVIGTVRFRHSLKSDITIWHNPSPNAISNSTSDPLSETKVTITKPGALTSASHTFYHKFAPENGLQAREKYEWKHSAEGEVRTLALENLPGENISQQTTGLKLVRTRSGEIVAVYVGGKHNRLYNPRRVAGKVRFVEDDASEELRLLAVMSILTIMERGRRNAVSAASQQGCVVL